MAITNTKVYKIDLELSSLSDGSLSKAYTLTDTKPCNVLVKWHASFMEIEISKGAMTLPVSGTYRAFGFIQFRHQDDTVNIVDDLFVCPDFVSLDFVNSGQSARFRFHGISRSIDLNSDRIGAIQG